MRTNIGPLRVVHHHQTGIKVSSSALEMVKNMQAHKKTSDFVVMDYVRALAAVNGCTSGNYGLNLETGELFLVVAPQIPNPFDI